MELTVKDFEQALEYGKRIVRAIEAAESVPRLARKTEALQTRLEGVEARLDVLEDSHEQT